MRSRDRGVDISLDRSETSLKFFAHISILFLCPFILLLNELFIIWLSDITFMFFHFASNWTSDVKILGQLKLSDIEFLFRLVQNDVIEVSFMGLHVKIA